MEGEPSVRLLTGNDLALEGVPSGAISGVKQRALFVALALHANETRSRDWLANLLWPDSSQDAARQSLRMALMNLRRNLSVEWRQRIIATAETLRLAIDRGDVDYLRLDDAAQPGKLHAATVENSFRGDLLAQFPEVSPEFDDFLAVRREYIRRMFVSAMTELLRSSAEDHDLASFERRQRLLSQFDPVNDLAAELSMEVWADAGRPEMVEQSFETFRAGWAQSFETALPTSLMEAYEAHRTRAAARAPRNDDAQKFLPAVPVTGRAGIPSPRRLFQLGIVAAFLSALALVGAYVILDSRKLGLVLEIARPEGDLSHCEIEAVADRYQSNLIDALSAADVGTIVVGSLRDYDPSLDGNLYEVRQAIDCTGEEFRGITTIVDKRTRDIIWSARHDALGAEFDLTGAFEPGRWRRR